MLKCKGGYILVDCGGIDLTKGETPQTISGLFARVSEAISGGKPVIATNCKWGTLDVTPINVFAIKFDDDTIIVTSSTLQVYITSEDVVTIVNMVGGE